MRLTKTCKAGPQYNILDITPIGEGGEYDWHFWVGCGFSDEKLQPTFDTKEETVTFRNGLITMLKSAGWTESK